MKSCTDTGPGVNPLEAEVRKMKTGYDVIRLHKSFHKVEHNVRKNERAKCNAEVDEECDVDWLK